MESIRILVVDDEPIARQVLREELALLSGVAVVGEAEDGIRALEQVRALKPDLVLLDLEMPRMGGFEVVANLEEPYPAIVVVTAFDQHAIQAFDAGAIDYLLKPVSQERLLSCIERIRRILGNASQVAASVERLLNTAPGSAGARPAKITGRLGEEYYFLDSGEVLAFQADREIVWIVARKQRYLATQPLKAIEKKLADLNFARIHRNSLVNLDHIVKMAPLSSQRWLLTLDNQQEFIVSKRKAQEVRKLLRW